ncbi:MAG: hypothetical protein ACR2M3_01525, partial [Thermomicrobiales bacterium]
MSEGIMTPKENPLSTFDADAIAWLETRMWQAYYAKQDARLFLLLVRLVAQQFGLPWARAVRVALMLVRPAMHFARTRAEYEAAIPDIAAAYTQLQEECGASFDANEVAAREVRWWVVHRHRAEMGAAALTDAIADLYAAIYRLPPSVVREAARLHAEAAFVSDDGRDQYGVRGAPYWQEVSDLLQQSYRALKAAVQSPVAGGLGLVSSWLETSKGKGEKLRPRP